MSEELSEATFKQKLETLCLDSYKKGKSLPITKNQAIRRLGQEYFDHYCQGKLKILKEQMQDRVDEILSGFIEKVKKLPSDKQVSYRHINGYLTKAQFEGLFKNGAKMLDYVISQLPNPALEDEMKSNALEKDNIYNFDWLLSQPKKYFEGGAEEIQLAKKVLAKLSFVCSKREVAKIYKKDKKHSAYVTMTTDNQMPEKCKKGLEWLIHEQTETISEDKLQDWEYKVGNTYLISVSISKIQDVKPQLAHNRIALIGYLSRYALQNAFIAQETHKTSNSMLPGDSK